MPTIAVEASAAKHSKLRVNSRRLDCVGENKIGTDDEVVVSPTAIRRGKYPMRAIAAMSFDESIAYTESQIALLAMTEDAKEGLKAFGEKRKPSWPGR